MQVPDDIIAFYIFFSFVQILKNILIYKLNRYKNMSLSKEYKFQTFHLICYKTDMRCNICMLIVT